MLSLLAGQDRRDSTSLKRETLDFEEDLAGDIRGMKVGIPKEYLDEGIDPEVRDALKKTMEILKERGASVEEFSLGMTEYVIPSYYIIASAEASSNLARFDGVKYGYRSPHADSLHEMYKMTRSEGFGTEVKRRIFLGSFVLSSGYYDAYYLKALKARAVIKEAFDRAFAAYDVLLGPAAPQTAPKIGESLFGSASDVSGRSLHGGSQSGRPPGHIRTVYGVKGGPSDRNPADWRLPAGEEDYPCGSRF